MFIFLCIVVIMSTVYTLHKPKLQDMLKIITKNKEYYNKLLISFENNFCF